MTKSTLIIVPTYNERGNIEELVERVFKSLPDVHLLFVDDASQDGTRDVIESVQGTYGDQIALLKRPGKLGLGSAYVDGFRWGMAKGFDQFIEMDADLSHDPAYLPTMVRLLGEFDVVIGSRYVRGGGTRNWSLFRQMLSRFGSLYARVLLGFSIRDATGGFNGWRRHTLERLNLHSIRSEGYAFQIELKHRAWLLESKITETPIVFVDRRVGQSKMSGRIVREAIYSVLGFRRRARFFLRGQEHEH